MNAFSVYSQEIETPRPAPLLGTGTRRTSSPFSSFKPATAAPPEKPHVEPLPTIVLELPDLQAQVAVAPAPEAQPALSVTTRLMSYGYWAGIILGVLLAGALIWTPDKPAVMPADEAPAWKPDGVNRESSQAPVTEPANGPSLSNAPTGTETTRVETPSSGSMLPQAIVPANSGVNAPQNEAPAYSSAPLQAAPAYDAAAVPGVNPPADTRTARGTNVRPGEAEPLGINTPVLR